MKCLIETDKYGNWGLRELPWKNLYTGTPVTWETYEALYGALHKLKDYEDTGLSPAEVEDLRRQQDRWIPVTERLPEGDKFVLATVSGIYNNITFSSAIQLAGYCETEGWFIEGYPDWDDPDVTAWQPLPEPYKGGQNET
ncbi:putative uncharacterized protein [Clostridium sp. CAG:299]|nr:putative uncharacterized protein [Clostridium sp. CAG:299]